MKRLFLVASIAAVSLLAQPPAGPRGAGRWGFPGWGQGPRAASPVTGAPYSALEVRTTQQVLANGNVITRQQQSNLYRDSSGRTRMDTTVQRPGGQTTTRVMVTDPVAGVIRNIDAQSKTVHEMALQPASAQSGTSPRNRLRPRPNASGSATVQTENLGVQTLNGVAATGTRVTRTIPAGAQGNTQPIQTVRETWLSSDLQVPVMVKTSDPRFGTTTMQLTNIVRAEPDATLFQVPAGYTVTQGRGRRGASAQPSTGSSQQQ